MNQMIIVDDEKEIRDTIASFIPWSDYNVEIIRTFSNGQEALDYITHHNVDLMLLDVRMPIMDGFQLLESLQKKSIRIQTIILSGYSDFDYARSALKFGVVDYLLKPCLPKDIITATLKAKEALNYSKNMNYIKQQYHQNLSVLKEDFLTKLILGDQILYPNLEKELKNYDIKFRSTSPSCVIIADVDHLSHFKNSTTYEDISLLFFSVKNIIQEVLCDYISSNEVFQHQEYIVIISNRPRKSWIEIMTSIKSKIKQFLKINISIGIGHYVKDIKELPKSYTSAQKALDKKFCFGGNTILFHELEKDVPSKPNFYPLKYEDLVISSMKNSSSKQLFEYIEAFFNALRKENLSKTDLLRCSYMLLSHLMHFAYEKKLPVGNLSSIYSINYYKDLIEHETLQVVQDDISKICEMIYNGLHSIKNDNKIIEKATTYIYAHYQENISLEKVSKHVYITPNYLSLLFKQEMGINFTEFLHSVRIEASESLLKQNPTMKVYELAKATGYNDPKYFSQIFKRYTNYTISSYKKTI